MIAQDFSSPEQMYPLLMMNKAAIDGMHSTWTTAAEEKSRALTPIPFNNELKQVTPTVQKTADKPTTTPQASTKDLLESFQKCQLLDDTKQSIFNCIVCYQLVHNPVKCLNELCDQVMCKDCVTGMEKH